MNAPDLPPERGDERTARLEALLPTLATRNDLAQLEGHLTAQMAQLDSSIKGWMLATVISLFLGFSGLIFTATRPSASSSQAPVVIYVPAAPAASR